MFHSSCLRIYGIGVALKKIIFGGKRDDVMPVSDEEYLEHPETFKICAKCGTPMRDLSSRTIRKQDGDFRSQPQWYCTKCGTSMFSGTGHKTIGELHPGIQDPFGDIRGKEALAEVEVYYGYFFEETRILGTHPATRAPDTNKDTNDGATDP